MSSSVGVTPWLSAGKRHRPGLGEPALGRVQLVRPATAQGGEAARHREFRLGIGLLLGIFRRLARSLERDLGGGVPAGGPQHSPAEGQRLRPWLECECAIEGQQRPRVLSQAEGGPSDLVPDRGKIGVGRDGTFQLGQPLPMPAVLDECRSGQRPAQRRPSTPRLDFVRQRECRIERILVAHQLEPLDPAGIEVGLFGEHCAVGQYRLPPSGLRAPGGAAVPGRVQ